jgi:glucokinase
MILSGDIGGTSTRLAFFEAAGQRLRLVGKEIYPSGEYASLTELVARFVSEYGHTADHAAFGVPGPVRDGHAKTTNLPWLVDAKELARALRLPDTALINDLEAHAHGLAALGPEDFAVLNEGLPGATGNAAVIAAGTGLGEAGLYWDGARHHPFASEGGHTDFGPRDNLEMDLLRYLLAKYGHASYERVLSGPGLHNLYLFLRDTGRSAESPRIAEAMHTQDPPAIITQAALDGESELCRQALELFVSLYGAEAGNLALKIMATGGVYLGGGIAPKIVKKLQGQEFMNAFAARGRMKPLLESIPVRVILNPDTPLLGAALYAARRASLIPDEFDGGRRSCLPDQ